MSSRAISAALLLLAALMSTPADAAPTFNTKEPGVLFSSAVFQAATEDYPALRLYYIRGSTAVYSATTTDGLTLVEEADVRLSSTTEPPLDIAISSITGLTIAPIVGGGFRMLYSVIGTTGSYRIYTATSADGLGWANSTGAVVDAGTTFAGHPSVVKLDNGNWRLWYVQNSIAGNQFANHVIWTALSTNQGRNFGAASLALNATAGQVSAALRTDNRVRVYYTAPAAVGIATHTTVRSALSSSADGSVLAAEAGIRLSTGSGMGALANPLVVRSTDTFRWRMYYNFLPFPSVSVSTADAWSAVTDAPDVQSISPSSILRTAPAPSFRILGEIFSLAPTAALNKGGQPAINGAGLARVNDQTIDVTLDTENQQLGFWDLTVTNANLQTSSLSNAVLVDFAGGDVRTTDNLLRPREGTVTRFDVTTYNDGNISVRVYTMTGSPVATLFEGHVAAGTLSVTWNGRTAQGHTAASGVYLVRATGPKLDAVNKVVLIK